MSESFPIEPAHRPRRRIPEGHDPRSQQPLPGPMPPQLIWAIAVVGAFVVVILIGGALSIRFAVVSERDQSREVASDEEDGTTPDDPVASADVESPSPDTDTPEQRSLEPRGPSQLAAFRKSVDRAHLSRLSLRGAVSAWSMRIAALAHSADGRRIAGSPTHLTQLEKIFHKPRPDRNDTTQIRLRLTRLLNQAEADFREEELLNPKFVQQLDAIETEIRNGLDRIQEDRAAVDQLCRNVSGLQQSELSLSEAITRYRREYAAERGRITAAARHQARVDFHQSRTTVTVTEAEQQRRVAQQQADARRDLLAQREAEQRQARLTREFERIWPEWKPFLMPFTCPGYMQPSKSGFYRVTTRGPVSFSALKASGRLENTNWAQRNLNPTRLGNCNNDRPFGYFPRYRPGLDDWCQRKETTQAVQKFLNRYGTIMVKKGLLAR